MTDIRPLRALRYDPDKVDLSRVLVPPYDVISPEERVALYEREPYCSIRLTLTRDVVDEAETDYSQVSQTLADWRAKGVLRQEEQPALYALRQRFTSVDGTQHVRDGFFAALRLEDYERRVVRPHERTLAGPKADRLKLLRAARTNLSPIFVLYEDPQESLGELLRRAVQSEQAITAEDPGGVENTLVSIPDAAGIGALTRFLAEHPVVIADGHHRYETALAYRDECRAREPNAGADAPHEFTLAYFANAHAPGSLLLPIHRLLRKGPLPGGWREQLVSSGAWRSQSVKLAGVEDIPKLLAEHLAPQAPGAACAIDDGSDELCVLIRNQSTDELAIRVVHDEVLGGVFGLDEAALREGAVAYAKDPVRAAGQVRSGEAAMALYLNPLSPDDVFRVTGAGEILPQKSTFFYPKLPTGLVFRMLEEQRP